MPPDPTAEGVPAGRRMLVPAPALVSALAGLRRRRAGALWRVAGCLLAAAALVALPYSLAPLAAAAAVVALVFALFVAALWAGWSVLVAAPLFALLLVAVQAVGPVPEAFAESFAGPAGTFVAEFLLLFLLGAIFGRAMTASGAAERLADAVVAHTRRVWAPLAVAAICALMTLGGVGVFVIAFSVYPVAREVHKRLGLPAHLIPAGIALGAFTATMTALPGAPSLTNVVAVQALGTTAFAAPLAGLFAALVMAGAGAAWLVTVARAAPVATALRADGPQVVRLPLRRALLPIAAAIATNAGLSLPLEAAGLPAGPAEALRRAAIPLALTAGIALALASVARDARREVLNAGAVDACAPLIAAALGVGFGATVIATPAVEGLVGSLGTWLDPAAPGYAALTAGLYAALVGSSSGGLYLALEAHGDQMLAAGAAPDAVHRFASLGASVLDTAPHSGAVLALLAVCRERHATAYRDVFAVSVAGPGLALSLTLWLFG